MWQKCATDYKLRTWGSLHDHWEVLNQISFLGKIKFTFLYDQKSLEICSAQWRNRSPQEYWWTYAFSSQNGWPQVSSFQLNQKNIRSRMSWVSRYWIQVGSSGSWVESRWWYGQEQARQAKKEFSELFGRKRIGSISCRVGSKSWIKIRTCNPGFKLPACLWDLQ